MRNKSSNKKPQQHRRRKCDYCDGEGTLKLTRNMDESTAIYSCFIHDPLAWRDYDAKDPKRLNLSLKRNWQRGS